MLNEKHVCPVCGFPGLDEPAYNEYGSASFGICPSCGTEFGYDDSGASHKELRRRWVESGMPWFSKAAAPPSNWNPVEQLKVAHLLD